MKPNEVIKKVTSKLRPRRKNKTGSAIAVTAGIASAIWVALKFRRDLYGPGGTKAVAAQEIHRQSLAERLKSIQTIHAIRASNKPEALGWWTEA